MTAEKKVQIAEAKGRPMLHWVGKRPLSYVKAFPAQEIERFDPTGDDVPRNRLFHGDNKDVLAWLLANGYRGKVDLVYIDPPFDSGADYVRQVELRGIDTPKMEGESHSLGEQIQYTDIWANDMYLQFMYERLLLLKELLSGRGSICVHIDYRRTHHLRFIMDEVFGEDNFRNEIVWCYTGPSKTSAHFPRKHDTILWYSRTNEYIFNIDALRVSYKKSNIATGQSSVVGRASEEKLKQLDERGKLIEDWWSDIATIGYKHSEIVDFPTQKPEDLLKRIISGLSTPNSLILDTFVGSGTTAAVAQRMNRPWIASDINKGAIQTTSKRLQTIIKEQIEAEVKPRQIAFEQTSEDSPAALSFHVYRVNDYDLQIQYNEAVNLAVEHIGVERTKSDTYFDGVLGKRLVKIVPFNHPLTLLDLQAVKDEVEARKDERDIVVVCLGKETTADSWLEDYNKKRPINKIEVIELRTDQKYGKFFVHQPAQGQVEIKREGDAILVEIEDFISPTIVERLEMDTPLFKAKIPDWRAMVDVVMIDLDYDGEVFDIDLSDVPERKDDLVIGHYELDAPEGEVTVAVKIIDMLGEEVLVTKTI